MAQLERAKFGSKLGVILATAGSAGTDLVHIAMDAPVGAVWSAV